MPSVPKTPNQPLRQESMKKFVQNTKGSVDVAYLLMQNMVKPKFNPPYFITTYHVDTITTKVGVIINLPARVATRDINNVSIYLDKDGKWITQNLEFESR